MTTAELVALVSTSIHGASAGRPLRLGLELLDSGAACVVTLPAAKVEERRPGDTLDIDLALTPVVLSAFLEGTIDSAALWRAIETGDVRLRAEVEPVRIFDLLSLIGEVVPLSPTKSA